MPEIQLSTIGNVESLVEAALLVHIRKYAHLPKTVSFWSSLGDDEGDDDTDEEGTRGTPFILFQSGSEQEAVNWSWYRVDVEISLHAMQHQLSKKGFSKAFQEVHDAVEMLQPLSVRPASISNNCLSVATVENITTEPMEYDEGARMKTLGCAVYACRLGTGTWILETGFWDDDGRWIDAETWND